jgi:thiosulfate dehydrogenase
MKSWQSGISAAVLFLGLVGGCTNGRPNERDRTPESGQTAASRVWDAATWRPPTLAALPNDSLGAAIRRGFALISNTHDSLPELVGANLNCTSCHLDEGRRASASPLGGVYARYPRYIDRTGAVVPIEDRVNYCFTRSLAGSRLPNDSRAMQDIVAYLAFISRGVPIGASVGDTKMPAMPPGRGDTSRGAEIYRQSCARCHGADGAGMAKIPALWGAKSFSIGASMARQERAASFIRHNMPFDQPGTLSDAQAYDVAAFITAKPRPDLPWKERDWPLGNAPPDVPYDTPGHKAFLPPRLLPRRNAANAYVPAPGTMARPATRTATPASQ